MEEKNYKEFEVLSSFNKDNNASFLAWKFPGCLVFENTPKNLWVKSVTNLALVAILIVKSKGFHYSVQFLQHAEAVTLYPATTICLLPSLYLDWIIFGWLFIIKGCSPLHHFFLFLKIINTLMFIWRINKENPEFVSQINNFMYHKKYIALFILSLERNQS